jgi:hypothetical protein
VQPQKGSANKVGATMRVLGTVWHNHSESMERVIIAGWLYVGPRTPGFRSGFHRWCCNGQIEEPRRGLIGFESVGHRLSSPSHRKGPAEMASCFYLQLDELNATKLPEAGRPFLTTSS